jgi:thiamine pyrophosphokinase
LGAFGGRFDQEISGIHALYKWRSAVDRLVLLGGENIATLLAPGKHTIVPQKDVEGPTCGLLPLGGKVDKVITKGLHWDLHNQSLEFGGLVSSSNRMDADEIEVITTDFVVWMNIVTIP